MIRKETKNSVGRKTKEDKLKPKNFRLSLEDLKMIDKKGIGKNSSERLRYIIEKFKTDKITTKNKRKIYMIEIIEGKEEADKRFQELKEKWEEKESKKFLLNSSLNKIMKIKLEKISRKKIETDDNLLELKTYDWLLENLKFIWNKDKIEKYILTFKKENYKVILPISSIEEDFILKKSDEIIEDTAELFREKSQEEELFSDIIETLGKNLFYNQENKEEETKFFNKKYDNGDEYRSVEYSNIIIIEYEFLKKENQNIIRKLKDLN